MANPILIKRSAVAAKVPATTDLQLGELAINTVDGKLFLKKNNGTESIVEIGAPPASPTFTSLTVSNGDAQAVMYMGNSVGGGLIKGQGISGGQAPGIMMFRGGDSSSVNGGEVSVRGGDTTTGPGGQATVVGGDSSQAGQQGGDVVLQGGKGGGPGPRSGVIKFLTNSLGTLSERFRITPTGAFAIGGAANYGTVGQVLTSQGNGAPTWSAIPPTDAGTMTGTSLAANVVTSSLTSVGTLATLKVNGTVTAGPTTEIYLGQSGGTTLFGFANTGIVGVFNSAAAPVGIGTTNSQPLIFGTSNAERGRFNTSGNFLIGTTTDDGVSRLQVNGAAKFYGDITVKNTAPVAGADVGRILINGYTGANGPIGAMIDSYVPAGSIGIDFQDMRFYTTTGNVMSERLRIGASGNVMIGDTTDSGNKFQVTGSSRFNGIVTSGTQSSLQGNFQANSGTNDSYLLWTNDGTRSLLHSSYSAGGQARPIVFSIGGSVTPLMTINANGNVLIGTTTDSGDKLMVVGGAKFLSNSTGVQYATVVNTATSGNTTNAGMAFATHDGTSVNNNAYMYSTSASWNYNAFGPNGFAVTSINAGGLSLAAENAAGAVKFFTAGAAAGNERMRITQSGRILINTTVDTGADMLQVNGGATLGASVFGNGVIELGKTLAGDRVCFIDFHTDDTNLDYSFRLIRNAGVNGDAIVQQIGTGSLTMAAAGGVVRLVALGNERLRADNNGILVTGTISETSTIMIKENVRQLEGGLDSVLAMRGVVYDLKDGSAKDQIGLIAEEVDEVLPALVQRDSDGVVRGVNYARMVAVLIEGMKAQEQRIKDLEAKVQELTNG